ncbi:MAG: hypothetical protein O7A64_04415 [Alphaproteobacteria bacterium]|nr:hypothetical protein [Alphaproteobacteria bacterium]
MSDAHDTYMRLFRRTEYHGDETKLGNRDSKTVITWRGPGTTEYHRKRKCIDPATGAEITNGRDR